MIGRLGGDDDRRPCAASQVVGQPVGGGQDHVCGFELVGSNQMGVTDDPEDLPLAWCRVDAVQAPDHDLDVAHAPGSATLVIVPGGATTLITRKMPSVLGTGPGKIERSAVNDTASVTESVQLIAPRTCFELPVQSVHACADLPHPMAQSRPEVLVNAAEPLPGRFDAAG